ncbi:UDP-N-acetylglucosamine diphosphorylase/glucosamine-1-phosphate N-acetyltransferase [Leptospira ryugenii]|uniref:UDP-N-acetylglucosamine diphosphorylase/glucosamine-1-phosphate N-acetyltransferase n=1 Tax=Leptospira ryugenii TaxID=1917863 RepID=A0A2P2E063_9LEPT|nr:glucose-1-phosphate thymidylyltransferase [Leptospira ryugenii]GBF50261.1 UDP-N-acetylglucosamine diphosphorylase/glucosamine-1-phosphate N-acetyltransferase [Leptospira ryugenii]
MATIQNILIDETNRPPILEPISRFHSFCEWNLAGMNLLERIKAKNPKANIYYRSKDTTFDTLLFQRYEFLLPYDGREIEEVHTADSFFPWDLQRSVTTLIEDNLSSNKNWKKYRDKFKTKSSGFHVIGKEKHLYIHPSSFVYPGVVIDTSNGPILIDENVKISPFSFLEGPLYIGKESRIDNAKIGGGTLIGQNCRVGGEVENSIILDYSNKHHEGFLGHSFVSSWVNIGALATTSDLKNNYGIVKLQYENIEANTGTIKFGSMIGPFSKIAIGVMMNTGSVIDIGSNLLDNRVSSYQKPFTWISKGKTYRLEEFIQDTKKIMARRSINLSEAEEMYLRSLYARLMEKSSES